MLKATIDGEGLEIWFTPSFNIKSTDRELAHYLRQLEMEVFDPYKTKIKRTKIDKSEWDAYLILAQLSIEFPKLNIKIIEHPKLEGEPEEKDKEKEPLLY